MDALVIFLAIGIGLIPAAIAKTKGYSFIGWWIYGTLFFIIAFPHSILKSPLKVVLEKEQERFERGGVNIPCPNCGRLIPSNTNICVFCGKEIDGVKST